MPLWEWYPKLDILWNNVSTVYVEVIYSLFNMIIHWWVSKMHHIMTNAVNKHIELQYANKCNMKN